MASHSHLMQFNKDVSKTRHMSIPRDIVKDYMLLIFEYIGRVYLKGNASNNSCAPGVKCILDVECTRLLV